MTVVRITETYDLCTRVDRMGMIGVHTPSTGTVKALYPGLWDSHRFIRMKKCDIALACASMLPADPLQIGTEAGAIAPQDMFNPILYKAVTNESFDIIMGRMNTLSPGPTLSSGHNANVSPEIFGGLNGSANAYYSLLSERGWKKSMPQAGLSMRGLVPLVYPILNTFGNQSGPYGGAGIGAYVPQTGDDGETALVNSKNPFFRGRAQRMPRIPTKIANPTANAYASTDSSIPNSFVACLIMPPSKLHQLYYRLRVTWTISFEVVRSANEYGSVSDLSYNAGYVYSEYMPSAGSKDMEKDDSMVASNDMDMELIMQAGM